MPILSNLLGRCKREGRGGKGHRKGEGKKGRNACYKNWAIRITLNNFLVIDHFFHSCLLIGSVVAVDLVVIQNLELFRC